MPREYSIHRGDNLITIARRFGTTPEALARANGLRDADEIVAGRTLTIPEAAGATDGFEAPRTNVVSLSVSSSTGRAFSTSEDGTPMFRQGDQEWAWRTLGRSSSIGRAGCAVTATAMAVSKITGRTITPGELDSYLDQHHGYTRSNAMDWSVAARGAGLSTQRPGWSLEKLNEEIDAGRPVALGVDYKPGSEGGANGTDHWVAVTRRERNAEGASTYFANDPATGDVVAFHVSHGRLIGDSGGYKSTGQMQVFGPASNS